MLEFRILGPLEVVDGGTPVKLGGPKQRATLAILLLHANRVVPIERLAEDLYAGAPPVTAVTQVHRQISGLRRTLGPGGPIETRPPGYLLRVDPDGVDLERFERLTAEGLEALRDGRHAVASERLRGALALWRGRPLGDVGDLPFTHAAAARLEEMQLAAVEHRIEADLAMEDPSQLTAELLDLASRHPFREHLHALRMLALHRAGRQAEALEVYEQVRRRLADELGLEPGAELQELQRSILRRDPALERERQRGAFTGRMRTVLVAWQDESELRPLVELGRLVTGFPGRELVLLGLSSDEEQQGRARPLAEQGGGAARNASVVTTRPGADIARIAHAYDAELVLLAAAVADGLPQTVDDVLCECAADVAVWTGSGASASVDIGLVVPFAGSVHDWAALELAAWLASSTSAPLELVGVSASGRGDAAARVVTDAALAVTRFVGVDARARVVEPTERAVLDAVQSGGVVVAGISARWPSAGIGAVQRLLVIEAAPPTLLVRAGPRPGGLAPDEQRTRFSWSLGR